ncbi:PIG-L family deacetylase [Erythrobacter sp. SDW2]|uniref:PIG-L family deacetylase n=1 Tax=Erythrobacter sp. SDW2 TaxID=2907154 RepID=UPI001F3834FB|nr:PIG-L family deacetylase [Erythrobacter sp. SDW2]UIP07553.1 PIG-L family deacetylase [Erythrobacter sp. SDW2]
MRTIITALALAAMAMTASGALAQDSTPRRVIAIVAHPDDEVFIAPVLARLAREGAELTLVFATDGDQGPGVSGMEKGAALARVRQGEARCSAAALQASVTHFFGLGDGTLGTLAHLPDSSAQRFEAQLEALLGGGDYDLALTWGPDGGYGHADHRMVSAITTEVIQRMGAGRPQLLYPGFRNGTLPPVPEIQSWATLDPALLPIAMPYEPADLAAASAALQCHKTQFDETVRAGLIPLFDQSVWGGALHLREALAAPAITPEMPG